MTSIFLYRSIIFHNRLSFLIAFLDIYQIHSFCLKSKSFYIHKLLKQILNCKIYYELHNQRIEHA